MEKTFDKDIKSTKSKSQLMEAMKPSAAFVGASWFTLVVGMLSYIIGLWRSGMQLNEKGYYFTVLIFGLFSVISVQKSVRDKLESVPISDLYYGISWFVTILSVVLLVIGLWNADMELSEKGFYGMSFVLNLFSVIAVQKNVRDKLAMERLSARGAGVFSDDLTQKQN
ncbi:MAG: inner membrane protein YiaA [Bacteroidota bacterium]